MIPRTLTLRTTAVTTVRTPTGGVYSQHGRGDRERFHDGRAIWGVTRSFSPLSAGRNRVLRVRLVSASVRPAYKHLCEYTAIPYFRMRSRESKKREIFTSTL